MPYSQLLKGRVSTPQQAYVITTVTHGRARTFENLGNARRIIQEMARLDRCGFVTSLAYVLMPDHLHWLFILKSPSLSKLVGQFKGRSASALNRQIGSRGPVWQKSFYDHAIRDDEDIRKMARYLVANPIRAGLVDDVKNYPHWDAVWLTDSLHQ